LSAKNTLKGIGTHFLVTMTLLTTETVIELFLHWNPSGLEPQVVDPIIKVTNWFLVGTIAQFCVLAFMLLLLSSAEELYERWKECRAKTKKKP